ncbi:pyridoxal kinase [Vibrio sp. 10N.286.49.C2]|uniref:pyridoxal kinase PdxY n=1 Tax=unclassified Vibrio TaxID=2614977 RepID=UPI000C8192D3|nr:MULTISPECIES: pyridoxal kinase PdxY [unclassified Vibrio]PMH38196.1 pyridoxal kinase [Vibrio sp. 10N.286.49.C2]PMH53598.1 pyridoxal kinase [Vibrio sp. 10N.286.49.B1]
MKGIISIQSHVVYGRAGNSAAVFPLQRLGFEVWPIHTVQFSNNAQYKQGWTGTKFNASLIGELTLGLDRIGALSECQGVLSGYLANSAQALEIRKLVRQVKRSNPNAIYVCDPVMGGPNKEDIVSDDVTSAIIEHLTPIADVLVPSQYELAAITGIAIESLQDAIAACRKALTLGPKMIVVKHLHSISDNVFTMLFAMTDQCYMVQRPFIKFDEQPIGIGDLISALFTAGLLSGSEPHKAFEYANNACYGILKETHIQNVRELQIVSAQDCLIEPKDRFMVQRIY